MAEIPNDDQWLAAALRSSGDPTMIADHAWHIVWMNPPAEALTGCRLDTARKQSLWGVLPLLDEVTGLPPVVAPDRPCASTYFLRRAGVPDCPLEVSCSRIAVTPATTGFLLTCRDLTADRERESLLVQRERLEAIAGLAGGVGHDLNNYLTIIHGYTEDLRLKDDSGDQIPLEEIAQASLGARGMTQNLMALARRSPSEPEVLILSDLVAEMGGAISRLLNGKRTLRLAEDPGKAKVKADRRLLKQALIALAVFARDAKSPAAEFSIEARSVEILEGHPLPGWSGVGPCVLPACLPGGRDHGAADTCPPLRTAMYLPARGIRTRTRTRAGSRHDYAVWRVHARLFEFRRPADLRDPAAAGRSASLP
jgi:hypothetical protein